MSNTKESVLIVAGGGGGSIYSTNNAGRASGGSGGGYKGEDGIGTYGSINNVGTGGTQTSGGLASNCSTLSTSASFGRAISGSGASPGAGGGYYGGGGSCHNGSAGGSGFINTDSLIRGTYAMYCYGNSSDGCDIGTYKNGTYGAVTTYKAVGTNSTPTVKYAKEGNGYARITLMSVD